MTPSRLANTVLYIYNKQLAGRPRHRRPPTSDCKHYFLQIFRRHRVCRKTCGISEYQGTGTAVRRAWRCHHPRLCRAGRTCCRCKGKPSNCNRLLLVVVRSLLMVVRSLLWGVDALMERGCDSDRSTFHCRRCWGDIGNTVPKGTNNRTGHICRADSRWSLCIWSRGCCIFSNLKDYIQMVEDPHTETLHIWHLGDTRWTDSTGLWIHLWK